MVKRCAWGLCNSDTRYPERLEGGVKFIPFPKPTTNLEKCLRWIKACGRPHDQLNVKKVEKNYQVYVCTKHFVGGAPSEEYPDPIPPSAQPGTSDSEKPQRKRKAAEEPKKVRKKMLLTENERLEEETDDTLPCTLATKDSMHNPQGQAAQCVRKEGDTKSETSTAMPTCMQCQKATSSSRCTKCVQLTRWEDLGKPTRYLCQNCCPCQDHLKDSQPTNAQQKLLIWYAVPAQFGMPPKPPNIVPAGPSPSEQQRCGQTSTAGHPDLSRVADCDKEDSHNPVVTSEVKVEIDVAEGMPEPLLREEPRKAAEDGSVSGDNMPRVWKEGGWETQSVPSGNIGVKLQKNKEDLRNTGVKVELDQTHSQSSSPSDSDQWVQQAVGCRADVPEANAERNSWPSGSAPTTSTAAPDMKYSCGTIDTEMYIKAEPLSPACSEPFDIQHELEKVSDASPFNLESVKSEPEESCTASATESAGLKKPECTSPPTLNVKGITSQPLTDTEKMVGDSLISSHIYSAGASGSLNIRSGLVAGAGMMHETTIPSHPLVPPRAEPAADRDMLVGPFFLNLSTNNFIFLGNDIHAAARSNI